MEIELVIAILILFVLTFLATIDMAFSQLSDISLRKLSSDPEGSAKLKSIALLQEILENRPRFRFALSTAIQILLISFTVLITLVILRFYSTQLELLAVSLLLCIVASVIFRQFIPRLLTWRNPETKLLRMLPFVRPFYGILSTLSDPFHFFTKDNSPSEITIISNQLTEEEKEDFADDIEALIQVGEAEGIIEEKDRELIETMFEFSEIKAGEIMTPRTEIVALPIDSTVKQARDLIIEEKYSRLPIYRETIDNVEGVIYVRDLLNAWSEDRENQKIDGLLRPAYFVPETKSVSELLKNMQLSHVQVALVIDEYGGVAGLITVEDILEEIVGEIEDEDTTEEEIVEIIEGSDKSYFDVLGSTDIGKIERLFDIEIEDDDFTTIAGLVTSEAGYVPKIGEKLNVHGLDVEILQADEKRLTLVRLRHKAEDSTIESFSKTSNQ
ncbi:MAG: hemolysin family protein [Pyrinomonadaceae bacterium]|jgi:CBS domain containing-hemolysin-like protein